MKRVTLILWRTSAIMAGPYDAGGYHPGKLPSSRTLMRFVFVRNVSFPSGLTGSLGSAEVAATANVDLDIQLNGVSQGTMRFAAGSDEATFISVAAMSCSVGDVMTVVSPASIDNTLQSIGWMFKGVR